MVVKRCDVGLRLYVPQPDRVRHARTQNQPVGVEGGAGITTVGEGGVLVGIQAGLTR